MEQLQLEKYEVLNEIGQGGMSTVYRGRDPSLERSVAIKVMHRHLARDPEARERFAREAKAVARLTHHNIPEIYDFSSSDSDSHYLVTELVEGASLADLLKTHETLPELAALVGLGIAAALQHAHDHDIVHRDVKPENILVGNDGVVKLTDFGIAQFIGLESMTITGTLVGSPAHMSPEQIADASHLDPRADVWALGTVLYAVATGELPFQAGTPHAILKKITDGNYADPRRLNPHIDSELRRIIKKCMTVDRNGRYPSMNALFVELKAWLDERNLTQPEIEIAAWMADPKAYIADLSARLVATLMARADADLARKERHRALEALNRVLTLDPDHEEAFERVRKLTTGLRLRRLGIQVGAATLAVGLAVGSYFVFSSEAPSGPPTLSARSAAGLVPVRVPPNITRTTAGRSAGSGLAATADRGARLLAEAHAKTVDAGRKTGALLASAMLPRGVELATTVRRVNRPRSNDGGDKANTSPPPSKQAAVRLLLVPPAISATVDGKRVLSKDQLDLKVGQHTAVLRHPECKMAGRACPDTTRLFKVRALPGVQTVTLRYRFPPMTVTVQCNGGTVYFGSRRLGPCGKTLSMPAGMTKKLGKFHVVFASGNKVMSGLKTIAPGATVEWVARE